MMLVILLHRPLVYLLPRVSISRQPYGGRHCPLLADQRLSCSVATQASLRIASSAARARNPDRVSPCFLAWASTARRIRCGKVMLTRAALSPSSLASTSTTAQVQLR